MTARLRRQHTEMQEPHSEVMEWTIHEGGEEGRFLTRGCYKVVVPEDAE